MTRRTPDDWAAAVRDELGGLTGPETLAGTVQVDVIGGPDGDVYVNARYAGGRLADARPGPADGPDATLTITTQDAVAVIDGALDPSVAFMRGRLKAVGDMGLVLDLLAWSATDAARAARGRLAGLATA
jgi:hypothetical protein